MMHWAMAIVAVAVLAGAATASPEIRFSRPARAWDREALPIGNGRIGAMVFGRTDTERIQFNDVTLWSGGKNPSGAYDVKTFGTYQSFGDLTLETASGGSPRLVCASGHAPDREENGLAATMDGNPDTKWCVIHEGKPLIWQIDLPQQRVVAGYSLTSADDMPLRDPRTWRLDGSDDGQLWTPLDWHDNEPPFASRHEKRRFAFANQRGYRHYRIVFKPATDATHCQVAEIALDDVSADRVPAGYERTLDLATGIARARWTEGGVTYTREALASGPGHVIVVRLTADRPGKLGGVVRLTDARKLATRAAPNTLAFAGALENGLRYAARLRAVAQGGSVATVNGALRYQGCDSLTLILGCSTDYALDPATGFRSSKDPAEAVSRRVAAAAHLAYDQLRADHIRAHAALFGRVKLDLGAPPVGLDTPARLKAYAAGRPDPDLEATLFQYGRYLLLSCSRTSLPANLQGLWADDLQPAWFADYHTNINLQMNYWGAEPGNLSECAMPLLRWVEAMVPGSREATLASFGKETPGWTMRTSVNASGGNGWEWNLPASAWLAQHFMDHYEFTGDRAFLRASAWPILRDVSEFWLHHLVERNGKLVAPMGWSPEHGPREDGVAHDQQIVWDLFTNTLNAADALGADPVFRARVASARDRLLGPQVGSWGQIMEWTTERPELEKSDHRHTSHLFAVYPGRQISLSATPEWAKAAIVSLEGRATTGDSRRSWTWPWRTAFWARLGRPEKAHEMVASLLRYNTMENLFTVHPPFQMDGNFGIVGGMGEMLLQSHVRAAGANAGSLTHEIGILPALPSAWRDGSYSGMRARGGFELGAQWEAGRLRSATLRSTLGGEAVVRLPGGASGAAVSTLEGEVIRATAAGSLLRFATRRGRTYTITPGP
jgi:alpha-L-fucosidase 2